MKLSTPIVGSRLYTGKRRSEPNHSYEYFKMGVYQRIQELFGSIRAIHQEFTGMTQLVEVKTLVLFLKCRIMALEQCTGPHNTIANTLNHEEEISEHALFHRIID